MTHPCSPPHSYAQTCSPNTHINQIPTISQPLIHPSIYPPIHYPSIHSSTNTLSITLISLDNHLSTHTSIYPSIHQIYPFTHPTNRPIVHHLSIHPPAHTFIVHHLSTHHLLTILPPVVPRLCSLCSDLHACLKLLIESMTNSYICLFITQQLYTTLGRCIKVLLVTGYLSLMKATKSIPLESGWDIRSSLNKVGP